MKKDFVLCSRQATEMLFQLENILCITMEKIVITDFGFSKLLQSGETLRGISEQLFIIFVDHSRAHRHSTFHC